MEDKIRQPTILVPALPLVAAVLVAVLGPRVLKAQSHWLVVLALIASFGGSVALLVNVCQSRRDSNALYRSGRGPTCPMSISKLIREGSRAKASVQSLFDITLRPTG